jgi:ubiquinone/menaquinone biosynthesis C-methylase UbiE
MPLVLEEAVKWLRDQPDSEQIVQACYFDENVIQAAHRFWQSDEFQSVLAIVRNNHKSFYKVLDLGAGRGIASFAFAKEGCDVVALEPDTSPITGVRAIAEINQRTQFNAIKIVRSYGEELPFQDRSFDVVYIRQVLHHVLNLKKFCQDIYRVLKPDGLLLATREHVLSKKEDLSAFHNSHLLHHLTEDENALLLSEYLEAMTGAGFQIKNVWGSYDTVINYFPDSLSQVKSKASTILKPYVPARVVRPFLEIRPFFDFCSKNLSRNNHTPGRLYSFLALKE